MKGAFNWIFGETQKSAPDVVSMHGAGMPGDSRTYTTPCTTIRTFENGARLSKAMNWNRVLLSWELF
jgi:hypothetical protein